MSKKVQKKVQKEIQKKVQNKIKKEKFKKVQKKVRKNVQKSPKQKVQKKKSKENSVKKFRQNVEKKVRQNVEKSSIAKKSAKKSSRKMFKKSPKNKVRKNFRLRLTLTCLGLSQSGHFPPKDSVKMATHLSSDPKMALWIITGVSSLLSRLNFKLNLCGSWKSNWTVASWWRLFSASKILISIFGP